MGIYMVFQMSNDQERDLDPPEHWTCDECGRHFDMDFSEESEEEGLVLCYQCATFDG